MNDPRSLGPLIFLGCVIAASVIVYVIPYFVASWRKHPHQAPIAVVNIFLGWTVVGWVVALAWSLMPIPEKQTKARPGTKHEPLDLD